MSNKKGIWRSSHHSSRIFFVSGQAQQALHFGFSPGAAALVSDAGVGDSIAGVVAEAVFPMFVVFDLMDLKVTS